MDIDNKYDIILPNEYGRKYTVRYKQYLFNEVEGIKDWNLFDYGCGIVSMATILSSLGLDLDPIKVAQLLLLDEYGNGIDFYTNKERERKGLISLSFVYLLQELVRTHKYNLEYQILKLSYEHPELKKEKIIEMIKNEYMALIFTKPGSQCLKTFSQYAHYIAITSVNSSNNEFYIANPNQTGDNQIDITFSYELILSNMCTRSIDFLMIKNNDKKFIKK